MEFGLQLGNLDWQRLRDTAQEAEELGFETLMLPDHIVYEGPERQYDPRYLSYDAMVRATILIEATRRARIGHLVLCNLFRHPVITAQGIASLDTLSGGRVFAGLGSGWTESEFRMTGIPYPDVGTRLRMLDEALTCMRSLWMQEKTTFAGEFYRFQDAILWPKPAQKPHPPILLGGGGRGLLRVAAKNADVINVISDAGKPGFISVAEVAKLTDESFRSKVRFVREEARKHGRTPGAIRISNVVFSAILTDSAAASRAAAESMAPLFQSTPEAIVHSPLALIGTPEECVTELRRRTKEWELSQIVFSFSDETVMRRLAKEVLPNV
jgi:probable F420-dependent oxidoreductase